MNRLVFGRQGWSEFRERLLADAPLEAAAIILAQPGRGRQGVRLLVSETLHPAPEDYLSRSPVSAVLAPAFVARALQRARREGLSMLLAHSHPFEDGAAFSRVDDRGEALLAPTLYGRAPVGPHGAVVVGRSGFCGRLFDAKGSPIAALNSVAEVGPDVRVFHPHAPDGDMPEVYDRNVRAFGAPGQRLLSRLQVAVVGVGGTGSFAVEELARLGVGTLVLIDDETLETTNLNRVVGSAVSDVGRAKVEVAADLAKRANPRVDVTFVAESVAWESVARRLIDCDFVFCCTDSHGSRAVINQIAYQYGVPTIDIGVRIDAAGETVTTVTTRVQMLAASLACLVCHPLLDPAAVRRDLMTEDARRADPYIVGFHEPQPAVVSINGAATSAAVTMFLAAVTGLPGRARHLVGRPLDGVVRPVVSTPAPGCVVCGTGNAVGRGDAWPAVWLKGR